MIAKTPGTLWALVRWLDILNRMFRSLILIAFLVYPESQYIHYVEYSVISTHTVLCVL